MTNENIRTEEGDGFRIPKLLAYCDTGKTYPDGNPIMAKVELYQANIYSAATEKQPYGAPTDKKCYRISLGKYPKVGLSKAGLETLEAAIVQLKEKYPLE